VTKTRTYLMLWAALAAIIGSWSGPVAASPHRHAVSATPTCARPVVPPCPILTPGGGVRPCTVLPPPPPAVRYGFTRAH
jgi:hypothetical protein